jgi:hypothetical protein
VSAQDGKRAVDLFGEDGAGELVRHGEGGKGEQQVGVWAPGWWQAVVAADDEDKVVAEHFSAGEEGGKSGGIEAAAGGVEEDFFGAGMTGPEVRLFGTDFSHVGGGEAGYALDVIRCERVGVRVFGAADVVKEDLHEFAGNSGGRDSGGRSTTLPSRQRRSSW